MTLISRAPMRSGSRLVFLLFFLLYLVKLRGHPGFTSFCVCGVSRISLNISTLSSSMFVSASWDPHRAQKLTESKTQIEAQVI